MTAIPLFQREPDYTPEPSLMRNQGGHQSHDFKSLAAS